MEIFKIITLSLSSLMLVFVGLMRLRNPIQTYLKNSGIQLNNDVDLLNEMRGVSSVMLFAGITICLGTFMPGFRLTSLVVATLIFMGFAIGRFISLGTDGQPNKQIIQGIIFELVLGGTNIIGLVNELTQ